jgi:hypothetical protein
VDVFAGMILNYHMLNTARLSCLASRRLRPTDLPLLRDWKAQVRPGR